MFELANILQQTGQARSAAIEELSGPLVPFSVCVNALTMHSIVLPQSLHKQCPMLCIIS